MTHPSIRFVAVAGVAGCLFAMPARAQIKAIAAAGPTQLTAKQIAVGVQLDWLAPNPTYPGVSYKILRSDATSPQLAVVSPAAVTLTTYTDQLGTLTLSQPKTYTYAVQAFWPNGAAASSGSVTITVQPTQRVGPLTPTQCLMLFDLPAPQLTLWRWSQYTNSGYSNLSWMQEHLTLKLSAPGYSAPVTMTIVNSSTPTLVANGSFQLDNPTAGAFLYDFPNPMGSYPGSLTLSFDITLSTQDAQCTTHRWMTHWTYSGSLP